MQEAHRSPYATHLGGTKMRENFKQKFYWDGMKRDIEEVVARCLKFQKVKIEHQHPSEYLYLHDVPTKK